MPATGLEPRPAPPAPTGLVAVDGRTFPLAGAAIRAHAAAGLARTTFEQHYTNPHAEPLEVLYTLPLPADGAVIGYTIHCGDKIIRGHVETCEDAQKTYQHALAEGRIAGLLTQERADTFTQQLGSLPPGAEVRVEIDVLHPLGFHPALETSRAEWEYRFPTVVGVRYEGAAGRVPDADRLAAERADASGTPARLSLELAIADGDGGTLAPQSSSHDIIVADAGDGSGGAGAAPPRKGAVVRLEQPARLDRDVVITWQAGSSTLEARLVMGPGLSGDGGRYGLLTITPPISAPAFARDLTILIDASGSMSGKPLAAAKAVASRLLQSLTPDDRFEILAFARDTTTLVGGPVAASGENIARAIEKLAALQARGGTEMADAIRRALSPLRSDSLRQVVLLSDGYIGFENEVVAHVLQDLPAGARLHTVGIGHSPNRSLTRAAARAGRGIELLVAGRYDLDRATSRLLAATVAPILTDLEISGSALIGQAPARARDVLAGEPLRMALAFDPRGGELVLSGHRTGETRTWEQRWTVPAGDGADLDGSTQIPIGALYGREAIEDEEMRLAAAGQHGRAQVPGIARADRGARAPAPHREPPHEPRRRRRGPDRRSPRSAAPGATGSRAALRGECRGRRAHGHARGGCPSGSGRRHGVLPEDRQGRVEIRGRDGCRPRDACRAVVLPSARRAEDSRALHPHRGGSPRDRVRVADHGLQDAQETHPHPCAARRRRNGGGQGGSEAQHQRREARRWTHAPACVPDEGPHALARGASECGLGARRPHVPSRGGDGAWRLEMSAPPDGHPEPRETKAIEVDSDLDRAFARVRGGDPEAFADWLRSAEIPLRRSLETFARDVDIEAVLQEGLLRMWVLAPTLDLSGRNASLRYAIRITRNLALGEVRRLGRTTPLDLESLERLPEAQTDPDPPADPNLRRLILGCIDRLPERPRAALNARIQDAGRSPDRALATTVKMKTNTFLQNIVRARRLMAECLERAGVALVEAMP